MVARVKCQDQEDVQLLYIRGEAIKVVTYLGYLKEILKLNGGITKDVYDKICLYLEYA